VRFPESWSSTSLPKKAALSHHPEELCLDKAFALIEGFREMSVSGVGTIEAHLLEEDFWTTSLRVRSRE